MAEAEAGRAAQDRADQLSARIIAGMADRGLTLAVAESITGGVVCGLLTAVPGASQVVRGAVVAYATDVKTSLLGVDAGLLATTGPVTADVAAAMARGARDRLGAAIGVATTGEAGPKSASGEPVGTVFVAVATYERDQVRRLKLVGERAAIRRSCAVAVLGLLADVVDDIGGTGTASVIGDVVPI